MTTPVEALTVTSYNSTAVVFSHYGSVRLSMSMPSNTGMITSDMSPESALQLADALTNVAHRMQHEEAEARRTNPFATTANVEGRG